jgi:hypothetical protein
VRFEVEIVSFGPALAFDLPFDPKAELGKVRAPVRVTRRGARPGCAGVLRLTRLHHRKEYVRWVEEAKREETRKARFEKAAATLSERVRRP